MALTMALPCLAAPTTTRPPIGPTTRRWRSSPKLSPSGLEPFSRRSRWVDHGSTPTPPFAPGGRIHGLLEGPPLRSRRARLLVVVLVVHGVVGVRIMLH